MKYKIVFNDGTEKDVTCKKYISDSGVINFVDSSNNVIFMTVLFGAVKYIEKIS